MNSIGGTKYTVGVAMKVVLVVVVVVVVEVVVVVVGVRVGIAVLAVERGNSRGGLYTCLLLFTTWCV